MKKRVLACLLLPGMLAFAACGGSDDTTGTAQAGDVQSDAAAVEQTGAGAGQAGDNEEEPDNMANTGNPVVEIEVRDHGTITVELDPGAAPETVANFLKLAGEGFYDGLTFHRIIEGFMIQGGDPLGDGTGGSDEQIKGEFSSNGVDNPLRHTRGAISMARSALPDSASSQFFIVHKDSLFLDGEYAAFGYVTGGMEVVDAIASGTPVRGNNGEVDKADQPVITAVRVVSQ